MNRILTKQIRVYGIVQGVGFRPTVSRHAAEAKITGTVCNRGPYVEIFAQGDEEELACFLNALEHRPPKRAAILKLDVKDVEIQKRFTSFEIIESEKTEGEIFISPDIAICDACREELFDPSNRRYLHPFINCTCCGPRLTILDALPYDRERTSMKEFPMCPECEEEYVSPKSRRYDAQPVCCNSCGPEVYLIGRPERGREAILALRACIRGGGIAAIKGIGGFHLCCDARNEAAVSRLRQRKNRPAKPFAVMARDMEAVRRECLLTEVQEEILTGHQKPILLLERREGGALCPSVAPDNPRIGVMLPYAPIQLLLFQYDDGLPMTDVVVMTSANTSGAPICRDDEDARRELSELCDLMLSNDRRIRIRADDTVMDFHRGKPYMIRRSRGYAPLPVLTSCGFSGTVLAMGGELKNTFCIGVNDLFYPSPYVGDLEDLRTVRALRETVKRFETLLEVQPAVVAADLHPRYNSTLTAQELGLPVVYVQHHYAHILSCMAENDYMDPVIGVSFDGTGYGTDQTVWGGELLLSDSKQFQRRASIAPFLQVGGDSSAREGWRIAVSMIAGFWEEERAAQLVQELGLCDEKTCRVQLTMRKRSINAVRSTSAGRLFDAVSAILGIRKSSTFEGEASTALEFAAEAWAKRERPQLPGLCKDEGSEPGERSANRSSGRVEEWPDIYLNPRIGEGRLILPTDLLVRHITERYLEGESPEKLAFAFHAALAEQIVRACGQIRGESGCHTAALSGGVFQNRLLLTLTQERLEQEQFRVLTHSMIPPNDGGIALGQALYAMRTLQS